MKRKLLVLGMVAVLVIPMAVLAEADTTMVSGSIQPVLEVNAPSNISLGVFDDVVGPYEGTSAGNVVSTLDWTLVAGVSHSGIMSLDNLGVTSMETTLGIGMTLATDGSDIAAYQTELELAPGYGDAGTFNIDLFVPQEIVALDLVEAKVGTHSVILTYTATATP